MQRHRSALAMGYFKTRKVGVRERRYIIVENFADLLKNTIIRDVTYPFDNTDSMPNETMERFYRTVE